MCAKQVILYTTCRSIVQAEAGDPLLMQLFKDAVFTAFVLLGGTYCWMRVSKLDEMRVGTVLRSLKCRYIESG